MITSPPAAGPPNIPKKQTPIAVLRSGLKKLDEYSKPRPHTAANLEEHDYIQSMLHALGSGYAFMDYTGVAVTVASAVTTTFVARKTKFRPLTVAVGVTTGAVVGGIIGSGSPHALAITVGSAMLGAYQGLSGDREARVRDAAEGGTIVTMFLPGTAKLAGSIGAGVGAASKSPLRAVLVGTAAGAAMGAALGASGLAPGGVLYAAAISALGGGLGSVGGPRFAQVFRNLANDMGHGANSLARKAGVSEAKLSETTANVIGAFPATFAREGLLGLAAADLNLSGFVANGLAESLETAYCFVKQRQETVTLHHVPNIKLSPELERIFQETMGPRAAQR